MQFESAHCREARHLVATVDGVAGIGDIVKRGKHFEEAECFVSKLQVEQRIVLMLHVVRHVQSADASQLCIHKQLRQCLPADAEVVQVLRRGSQVVERCVQLAVCGAQGQFIYRVTVCRHLDSLVPEAARVHVLHVHGLKF